jgi:hypothetical protein
MLSPSMAGSGAGGHTKAQALFVHFVFAGTTSNFGSGSTLRIPNRDGVRQARVLARGLAQDFSRFGLREAGLAQLALTIAQGTGHVRGHFERLLDYQSPLAA